jgi:predicted RNase H-like HicB family nuclease
MQVPILIELLPDGGFRATAGFPFCLTAEGKTRDEVLQKIRGLIEGQMTVGREILQLEIPISENPWLRNIGTFDSKEPLVQEWLEIMAENRRKDDSGPDFL